MLSGNLAAIVGKRLMELKLDSISNNLANVSTPGYKTQRIAYEASSRGNSFSIPDISKVSSYTDFSQGQLNHTGNDLDLAISGPGFFTLKTPYGLAYTRCGKFSLDRDKRLVNSSGYPVMGEGGEIVIDGTDVSIGSDGSVYAGGNFVDRLKIVEFKEPNALERRGENLFVKADQKVEEHEAKSSVVHQGFIESSNVDLVRELSHMILVLRTFEAYSRIEQIEQDAKSKLSEIIRI